jgi:hypothetical protein
MVIRGGLTLDGLEDADLPIDLGFTDGLENLDDDLPVVLGVDGLEDDGVLALTQWALEFIGLAGTRVILGKRVT